MYASYLTSKKKFCACFNDFSYIFIIFNKESTIVEYPFLQWAPLCHGCTTLSIARLLPK